MADFEKWFKGRPENCTYVQKGGLTVLKSKNLRGLIRYASRSPVVKVETRKCPDLPVCGEMRVTYTDGDQGFAFFRSHEVLIDWVRTRRSWKSAQFVHVDGNTGYLTKPGTIAGV